MRTSAVVASVSCGILMSSQLVFAQGASEVETILYQAATPSGCSAHRAKWIDY